MWIQCNRPGGVTLAALFDDGKGPKLRQLKLTNGPNQVDDELYAAAMAAADPRWVKAMTEPSKGSRIPVLEPCEAPVEPESVEVTQLSAKDKVALVMAAETFETLEVLADGETRKTVLEALDKRTCQLADSE